MSFNIIVEGGKSVRLTTGGKYCDRDIVVTAEGGNGENLDAELAEQDDLIEQIEQVLAGKASGGDGSNANYIKLTARTSDKRKFTIQHSLGVVPRIVMVHLTTEYTGSDGKIAGYFASGEFTYGSYVRKSSSGIDLGYVSKASSDTDTNNGRFYFTDQHIWMTNVNDAADWLTKTDYEVEIWL